MQKKKNAGLDCEAGLCLKKMKNGAESKLRGSKWGVEGFLEKPVESVQTGLLNKELAEQRDAGW